MAGYSGTPLVRKLGIVEKARVALIDEPTGFRGQLEDLPAGVEFTTALRRKADVVVVFVTRRAQLARRIDAAGRAIHPNGGVWVAWPKRASGVSTDMTEDVVRELALPRGLVDNKVCAVDEIWSGLRIVWRREHR